jgi:hypothetical protein
MLLSLVCSDSGLASAARAKPLALDGEDLRSLPLSMRMTDSARLLTRQPDWIFVAPFEQGEIGPNLFVAACNMGLEGMVSNGLTAPIAPADRKTGSRSRTASIRPIGGCRIGSNARAHKRLVSALGATSR